MPVHCCLDERWNAKLASTIVYVSTAVQKLSNFLYLPPAAMVRQFPKVRMLTSLQHAFLIDTHQNRPDLHCSGIRSRSSVSNTNILLEPPWQQSDRMKYASSRCLRSSQPAM